MTDEEKKYARARSYARAKLRLIAFRAVRGLGYTREDGKWAAWDWRDMKEKTDILVEWAMDEEESL